MLNINKIQVEVEVHNLAVANNVTDSQMASYIFRMFYKAVTRRLVADKIRRHAVAIANLTKLV